MGHGKETPRQKMIGMMYLVLTALLALNVSAEVLNAFALVDEALRKSYESIHKKSESIYAKFDEAIKDPSQKAKTEKWKIEADSVRAKTDRLFSYIDTVKNELVYIAEGEQSPYLLSGGDVQQLQAKGNLDIGGQVMVLQGGGMVLKKLINAYDSTLIDIIIRNAPKGDTSRYSSLIKGIKNTLKTDSIRGTERMVPWEAGSFEHLPLAAVLTMLSKTQTDVRNAEADILNFLYGQIDAGSWKFNKLEAIVNAKSNYVLVGSKYEAEVFIAASDSTTEPEIVLNGGTKLAIKEGKGQYSQTPSSAGFTKWGGVIKMESPVSGEILQFPFNAEFQAAESELVVSPTKMNVFYIGVDNPVSISVAGVPADKLMPSIEGGGSITKVKGSDYIVRVKQAGDAFVTVNAKFDDGSTKNMGKRKFRVKRVPDPVAKVAGLKGGEISKSLLMAQQGVKAELENFDFDLTFNIVGFTVSATVQGYEEEQKSNSAAFTAGQKDLMKKVGTGRKLYIEDIKARGPDGQVRDLSTISFKLK